MKSVTLLFSLVAALLVAAVNSSAQVATPGASDIPGLDHALRKLFEGVEGFSAEAVMDISGEGQKVKVRTSMAMLKGDTWMEVDMGRVEGAGVPPEMIEAFRKVGMDKLHIISIGKTGRELMVYPGLKAYAEAKPARTNGEQAPECQQERKIIGTEEVAGVLCEKATLKLNCSGEPELALTVWTDRKNKNLPVKLNTAAEGTDLTMTFSDLKLKSPDAKLFAVPADFKQHGSVEELMMANMQKMMQAIQGGQ